MKAHGCLPLIIRARFNVTLMGGSVVENRAKGHRKHAEATTTNTYAAQGVNILVQMGVV